MGVIETSRGIALAFLALCLNQTPALGAEAWPRFAGEACSFAIEAPRTEAPQLRSVANMAPQCVASFAIERAVRRRLTPQYLTPEIAAKEKLIRAATRTREAGELMAEEIALQKQIVSRLSLEELQREADLAIISMTYHKGYMPGCTPKWTPANVAELIIDHQRTAHGGSMLTQISRNLISIDGFIDFMRSMPPERALAEKERLLVSHWLRDAWATRVFEELEKRLDLIGQMGPRFPHSSGLLSEANPGQ